VINALIKTYGSPHSIHIEMARELSKPFDERKKIQTAQEEYRERNDKDRLAFANQFGIMGRIDGRDFEKYQLYREQQGKCAYSTQALDLHRLFEMGYAEIDHVLPYSRSFDDSKNNRVLVLAHENRNKGNRTPYEYLDGKNDSPQWREFVAFVNSNKAYRQAKRNRLLKKDFDEKDAKDFSERNLNDTRYIGHFLKNYIEQHLQLHTDSTAKRCVVVSGQLTSFLRQRWGLNKIRSESDRHHAMDAVVIACCSHSMVKRLADYSRKKELEKVQQGFVDIETGEVLNPEQFARLEQHFPTPWHGFRDELIARLSIDNPEILRDEIERLGTYHEYELTNLRPLFVSRAPQRRNSGAAHKETIYAQPESLKLQGGVTQKINLVDMKLSDMDSLIDPHRNEKLYTVVRTWLSQRDDKEKRAKEIEKTIRLEKRKANNEEQILLTQLRALPHKPTNNGSVGAVVRSLTKVIDKQSGIPIRGGVAKNDTMLRTDVFTKAGKFYLVPVYVHHAVAKELPNRAIVAHKPESEWTLIDDSFKFCFALYPNDLIRVSQKSEIRFGYYSGCNRATGSIDIWIHDRNKSVGKDGLMQSIGVRAASVFEKFNVDVLGNIYPITQEARNDLA
jgi:CRISPR-associated endonuclease Csn1